MSVCYMFYGLNVGNILGMLTERHLDLELREPEPTAVVRHQRMEWEVVMSHFEAIRLILIKQNRVNKFGAKI